MKLIRKAQQGAKLGVTSSNGQYRVSPENYQEILNTVSQQNPLQVTLPDINVAAPNLQGFTEALNSVNPGELKDNTVNTDVTRVNTTYAPFYFRGRLINAGGNTKTEVESGEDNATLANIANARNNAFMEK